MVPAVIHLSGFAGSQLVGLSTWAWTEGRATLRNAFWLNNFWGWSYPEYFPYAAAYNGLLLRVAEFAMPAIAFASLAIGVSVSSGVRAFLHDNGLRLAVAASSVALVVIFISTGTNPPGNVVFSHLLNLPYGWLLREPGRFLLLVALAYAVLSGALVRALINTQSVLQFARSRRVSLGLFSVGLVPALLAASICVGFPLYTGAVVPDSRPHLPPVHVAVPAYWTSMARYVDGLPVQGAVLVMPPDDFYQMPYTWGYYGTDNFVVDLFHRHVVIPNGQGYLPASSQLLDAVDLTAQSILHGDWREAEALVRALNAPLILVRRDIDTSIPTRSITSPRDLAAALDLAPNFVRQRQIGSLDLYALVGGTRDLVLGTNFATVNTPTPDLRLLSMLPTEQALVTSESQPGVSNVVQAPPVELWDASGGALVWSPKTPPGWNYRIVDLDSTKVIPLDRPGAVSAAPSPMRVEYQPDATNVVRVSLPAQTVISSGNFSNPQWGPVTDCSAFNPGQARTGAKVIADGAPGGGPALELSASAGTACTSSVSKAWKKGPVVVSLMTHVIQGASPRICLREITEDASGTVKNARCLQLPAIPDQAGWATYRASVTPDKQATKIVLYLYADGGGSANRTVVEYANLQVLEVPALPAIALLSVPAERQTPAVQLALVHSSFSTMWQPSVGGRHVLVDGMLNGWLVSPGVQKFSASYAPDAAFRATPWISLVGSLVALLLAVLPAAVRFGRRYLSLRSKRL
jgi:arabinofuranan 3-O-arabinosyltransferase